jgi:sugar phosphate isomerase/epimerase
VDAARIARYAETAFRRASEAGVEIVVFGSGGARTAPEGYPKKKAIEDFVIALRKVGALAEGHGVSVVVEP